MTTIVPRAVLPSPVVCRSAHKHFEQGQMVEVQEHPVELPPTPSPTPLCPRSQRVQQAEARVLFLKHIRQACNQSPELHLTFPFPLVQVKAVASTGLSSLGLALRVPSRSRNALPSRPPLPSPRWVHCMIGLGVQICLVHRHRLLLLLLPRQSRLESNLMRSKSAS
jgi:hypothetical protein